ncbi:MAG: hydroxymethylbilane synthase [Flavobacteriales bacterium]
MKQPLIIGTRGSDLALWQANHVQMLLKHIGVDSEIFIIKTKGDQIQHLSFDKIEGKGFFTKEIEESLLNKEVDIAVHSHKDLETEQPLGLTIAAVSDRADPTDLLLVHPDAFDASEKFSLKKNAIVGTSSARRKAQILGYREDVTIQDIRGNVPTRVQKLREKQFDAILLAKAGLDRLKLDLSGLHAITLDPEEFIPAPAQGVLAIQCRTEDQEVIDALGKLNNKKVQRLISIERSVLNKLQGGCQLPLGVYATEYDGEFTVHVSFAQSWDSPNRLLTFISDDDNALPDTIITELKKQ